MMSRTLAPNALDRSQIPRIVFRCGSCLSLVAVALVSAALPQDASRPTASGPRAVVPTARRSMQPNGSPPREFEHAALTVYRTHCLTCHGADGKGETARGLMPKIPDLTVESWHTARTDQQISLAIRKGKGKSMPGMETKIPPVDRERLVKLVRGFRGGGQVVPEDDEDESPAQARPAPNVLAATAKPAAAERPAAPVIAPETIALYARNCAICHGNNGKGKAAGAGAARVPDFTNGTWHGRRSQAQLAVSILDGKGNQMPAFRGKVNEQQARQLAAYVRAFNPAATRPARDTAPEFDGNFDNLMRELDGLRKEVRNTMSEPARSPARPIGTRPNQMTHRD
jgi:cytochrome c6